MKIALKTFFSKQFNVKLLIIYFYFLHFLKTNVDCLIEPIDLIPNFNHLEKKLQKNEFLMKSNSTSKDIDILIKTSRFKNISDFNYECVLNSNENISTKAYFSPTIFVAYALEKINFFSNFKENSNESNTYSKLKSYSVLFQIKKILKYENFIGNLSYLNSSKEWYQAFNRNYNNKDIKEIYNISLQEENSTDINPNSFILIDNLNLDTKSSCKSIDIKLNNYYFLFLNNQNQSIKLSERKYFTYPIRLSVLKRHKMVKIKENNFRSKRNFNIKLDLSKTFVIGSNNLNNLNMSKNSKISVFVRIPVFKMFTKPIIFDLQSERDLINVLIKDLQIKTTLKIKKSNISARLNSSAKFECQFSGNKIFKVYWKKIYSQKETLLEPNKKYQIIIENENTSILIVSNVNMEDQAYYSCFGYDYINGDIYSEKIIIDYAKLILNESETHMNQNMSKNIHKIKDFSSNKYFLNKTYKLINKFTTLTKKINNSSLAKKKSTRDPKIFLSTNSNKKFTIKIDNQVKNLTGKPKTTNEYNKHIYKYQITKYIVNITNIPSRAQKENLNTKSKHKKANNETLDKKTEKRYIDCDKIENNCLNEGECFKTNPKFYISNMHLYNLVKTKFCICKEFFEGQNCEIELDTKYKYNAKSIPNDLQKLWKTLE